MRYGLTLTQLAEAVDMSLGTLSAELNRSNVPGIPASAGNPGSAGRLFDIDTCILVALYAAQRRLSVTNQKLGKRAKSAESAANVARQAIIDRLSGRTRNPGALAVMASPDGQEWVLCFKNGDELKDIQDLAFSMHATLQTVPLEPIAHRLATAIAKANGIDLAAATDAVVAANAGPSGAETMPAAVADTGTTVGVFSVRRDKAAEGIIVSPEGLELLHRGEGLRIALRPEHWRELAKQADGVADAMEGKTGAMPDAAVAAWHLRAAAGNA